MGCYQGNNNESSRAPPLMVFNLASATLLYQDYLRNSTTAHVTYTEYALSITEWVLIILSLYITFQRSKKRHVSISLFVFTVQVFNIVYSANVVEYYNGSTVADQYLTNMSLAIIVLNSIFICIISVHEYTREDEELEQNKLTKLVFENLDRRMATAWGSHFTRVSKWPS